MNVNSFKLVKKRTGIPLLATGLLTAYVLLLNVLPVADLTKEFGIPSAVAAIINWYLDTGAVVSVITTLLIGVGSGGLGLIAAEGKTSIKVFLKEKCREMGTKAFTAW